MSICHKTSSCHENIQWSQKHRVVTKTMSSHDNLELSRKHWVITITSQNNHNPHLLCHFIDCLLHNLFNSRDVFWRDSLQSDTEDTFPDVIVVTYNMIVQFWTVSTWSDLISVLNIYSGNIKQDMAWPADKSWCCDMTDYQQMWA